MRVRFCLEEMEVCRWNGGGGMEEGGMLEVVEGSM